MWNLIQTKRQSPINSNESIEDIKQKIVKQQTCSDVQNVHMVAYYLICFLSNTCKKIWTQNRKTGLSTTHYDEMHYDEMQYTNVDNHHSYFDIQFKFILYVNIIM